MRTHLIHSILYFLRVVRLRRRIVAICVVVSLLLGALYYATATRLYEARASLLVLQAGDNLSSTSMISENASQGLMPTYERLMTSAVVLQSALNRLGRDDRVDFGSAPPDQWIDLLRNQLRAGVVRRTNIIELSYRSKSAESAVAVVNAVVQAYLEFMETTHKGTAGQLLTVLSQEKGQLEEKLTRKQNELLAARCQTGDVGLKQGDGMMHPIVQRAVSMNEAIVKIQQKRIELQGMLAAMEAAAAAGQDLEPFLLSMENEAGRELLLSGLGLSSRDGVIQADLEKNLLEDRAKLRTLQAQLGPNHPQVQETLERIHMTEQYLADYSQRVEQRLAAVKGKRLGPMLLTLGRQRLNEVLQQEAALRQGFDQAQNEAVQLNGELARLEILEHDVKWLRNLRDVLLNQIANIDLRQDQGDIRTAVVSEPVMSPPVWPNRRSIAFLSLVAGTLLGLAIVYVLDVLDDRFRSPQEIRLHLGLPILALVQRMEGIESIGVRGIQAYAAPDDAKSEAFRTLRTALAFAGQETNRLVVCSAEPGDGKTTVIANLAVSFANSGKNTLLIDADLRRPGLTRMLELRGRPGLSELLGTDGPVMQQVSKSVLRSGIDNLDVLPSGNWSTQASELLFGRRFQELLAWAETNYEQVLIDTPPILVTSDAATVSQFVDGVVLVLQPAKNQRKNVVRAADSFASVGAKVLGVVANCVAEDQMEGGYGYGYQYKEDEQPESESDYRAEAA